MAEDEESFFKKIFSGLGKKIIGTGKKTADVSGKMKERVGEEFSSDEESELSKRLDRLKRLEEDIVWEEETEKLEKEDIESDEWEEERKEIQSPLSERFANVFYSPLKSPATKLAGFFTGLERDLRRADMRISPEKYVGLLLGVGIFVGLIFGLVTWIFSLSLFYVVVSPIGGLLAVIVYGRYRPKSKIQSRVSEVNQQIPYALRHMASQLSSGVGLPETMGSVAKADYGALSVEFERTLREMSAGNSMDDSLTSLRERVPSDYLESSIRQIQRTIRTGGNLADTLDNLAEEAAFDLRMNLRDYTQSLNMLSMIYMFLSAVIPTMLIVLVIVTNFIGEGLFQEPMIILIYLIALPMLLFSLVVFFKNMEPEV